MSACEQEESALLLLGAYSAGQLSVGDIWMTREWTTNTFHGVQLCTIFACRRTWASLCVLVNTYVVALLLVVVVFSHQVPMVLLGPPRWTIIPCRHHKHWGTWPDKTYNARCIVVIEGFRKRVERIYFILSSIHESRALMSIFVLVILWAAWKTEIVYSAALMIVTFATYQS